MDEATLCYPRRGDEVLLIRKKRGIGAGKFVGPGGKVEPGETVRECVVRETREEVGLRVDTVEKRAEFRFVFGDDPLMHVHAFVTDDFAGTPEETAEADPVWVDVDDVPYDEMWADDRYWFPRAMDDETVAARFEFDAEGDELLDWRVEGASIDASPAWAGFDFETPAGEGAETSRSDDPRTPASDDL